MERKVEIIVIEWEKIDFKVEVIEKWKEKPKEKWDCGLYQIYGDHYAYGKDSLLYIGQAGNSFSERLLKKDRLFGDFLETTVSPESIRLGRIVKAQADKDRVIEEEKSWDRYIDIAENILISTHPPALNSQLTFKLYQLNDKYENMGEHYLIINLGDRGNLLPEVSTLRNSYLFNNYDTPFGFGR